MGVDRTKRELQQIFYLLFRRLSVVHYEMADLENDTGRLRIEAEVNALLPPKGGLDDPYSMRCIATVMLWSGICHLRSADSLTTAVSVANSIADSKFIHGLLTNEERAEILRVTAGR